MNDAIQQRVEQFVQEILSLGEHARRESHARALSVVRSMFADAEKPLEARASSQGRPPASPGNSSRKTVASPVSAASGTSGKATTSPNSGQVRRRGATLTASNAATPTAVADSNPGSSSNGTEGPTIPHGTRPASPAVVLMTVAPSIRASAPSETAGPATLRSPHPTTKKVVAPMAVAVSISVNSPAETGSPAPEREALVLDAVRALVQATASEVARRSGQPNGSVAVALRVLVARGLVTKAQTPRGVEYSLVSAGTVRPFNRAKRAGAAGGSGAVGDASQSEERQATVA